MQETQNRGAPKDTPVSVYVVGRLTRRTAPTMRSRSETGEPGEHQRR